MKEDISKWVTKNHKRKLTKNIFQELYRKVVGELKGESESKNVPLNEKESTENYSKEEQEVADSEGKEESSNLEATDFENTKLQP